MRIRKNSKHSSLILPYPPGTQTYVCRLNQSPWDVMSFHQETHPPSRRPQVERNESLAGNGSLGDSIRAVESVTPMTNGGDKAALIKSGDTIIHDNRNENRDKQLQLCSNNDREFGFKDGEANAKCSQCCNEPKDGLSRCDHHKSAISFDGPSVFKKPDKEAAAAAVAGAAGAPTGARRGRARAAKRGARPSASNPYEFYYYSGFGPSWGKRRGDRGGGEGNKNDQAKDLKEMEHHATENNQSSSTLQTDNEEFDYVDDEDDEEDNENEDICGKKRMRKPVKARSLKSLM